MPQLITAISINLAGIPADVQRTLQGLINRAAFGLHAAEDFSPDEIALPDVAFHLRLGAKEELRDEACVRADFRSWVLATVLRDAVEVFGRTLEEARSICATWALSSPAGRVSTSEWNKRWVEEARRFHSWGLPRKLDFLRREYGVALSEDKERDLLSLNRVRNCLVHRGGVVSLRDLKVTETEASNAISEWRSAHPAEPWSDDQAKTALRTREIEPTLIVTWLQLQLVAELDGAKTRLDPREKPLVPGGSEVSIQVRRVARTFDLGARVGFSSNDFAEICFTYFNAAQTLARALEEKGRSVGIQFTEENDT